uniref:Omega-hydroxypalmitate O-feruloyl transferase n=1 Tax=Anthurium amnicola TaxID=1678845 RepID=A0A1D1Y4U8_9ARAE
METTSLQITDQDVEKGEVEVLVSFRNPTPVETVYLSNIDQTVAFPVETIFFFGASPGGQTQGVAERVKKSVSEVLLGTYYFMAGRLNLNPESRRLELVCNNAGVPFAAATSRLRIEDLGDVTLPNPSFQRLILRTGDEFGGLSETPVFTVQVTRFACGGFSTGFVTNHSILDGRAAADMFGNLASVCRGEGMKKVDLYNDRTCLRARVPPRIQYEHTEYTKLIIDTKPSFSCSSFTSPDQPSHSPSLLQLSSSHSYRVFPFTVDKIRALKEKATATCSTFEALVAHVWRARTKAVFDDPARVSTVLFAVDVRSRLTTPLPEGFVGNAVVTASASATVAEMEAKPFPFCVEMVKRAIGRVTEEYVRSVIDWLEVHRGIPSTVGGNFFVSAWWKLPFHELDLGYGRPLYGGPVVSGMDEFVLLLSDGTGCMKKEGGGVNVWVVLEHDKMERFVGYVLDI